MSESLSECHLSIALEKKYLHISVYFIEII